MKRELTPAVLVDSLGFIKAYQANLENEEESIKVGLIDLALSTGSTFEGDLFRATVSFGPKVVVNYKSAIEDIATAFNLDPDRVRAILKRHTLRAEGVPQVRVTARRG